MALPNILRLYAHLHHTNFFSIPRRKTPPLDILKLFFTTLRNQDNKFSFIQVDEDVSLARSSKFMQTCCNTDIIVQTADGYTSSLNGNSEIPNKTLDDTTRDILINSSHKK